MSRRQHIVVLSGAGISAESGIATFRDAGGLWERHRIEDVATPEAFARNPALVLEFYNARRAQLVEVEPNAAHRALAALERDYDITIITQNIDDLHERAGSSRVLHLHGQLTQARSSVDEALLYDIGYAPIGLDDTCELGSPLRPHVVWFGEAVPMIDQAAGEVARADQLLVVGTSLQVYPAAGLVDFAGPEVPITVIDPAETARIDRARVIRKGASAGIAEWLDTLGGHPTHQT